MDKLAATGFTLGFFARLGAASFLGIHFSSRMFRAKYNLSPNVLPKPQVPRAYFAQTTSLSLSIVMPLSPVGYVARGRGFRLFKGVVALRVQRIRTMATISGETSVHYPKMHPPKQPYEP